MRQYIGIPYVEGGRDYEGADCWGLVRLYYQTEYGIELPGLDGRYRVHDSQEVADLVDEIKPTISATPVEWPQQGDVVVIKFRGYPMHTGIFIPGNRVLHTLSGTESVLEPLDRGRLKGRVEGYYRVG